MLVVAALGLLTTSAANAGTETEIKLGMSIIAVTSEDQCDRLIVAARANDQYMFNQMVEDKEAVIVPKGKTVIVENAEAEIAQDDTGGIARFHIRGSHTHLWTTNHMLSSALWAGDE